MRSARVAGRCKNSTRFHRHAIVREQGGAQRPPIYLAFHSVAQQLPRRNVRAMYRDYLRPDLTDRQMQGRDVAVTDEKFWNGAQVQVQVRSNRALP